MQEEQTSGNPLSHSIVKAIINAPIDKVDVADWLFNLPEAEYQRCSVNHIAAGSTATYDGQPMSINVEMIGDGLVVQHYIATRYQADYCRMESLSDVFTKNGRTSVRVIWELKVTAIDDRSCEFINEIHAFTTANFQAFINEHGQKLKQAAAARQAASHAHNLEEAPNFAKSIGLKALTGKYGI